MRRLLPSPMLSGVLFLLWLLMSQSVSPITLFGGVILALVLPVLTASLRPASVRMKKPLTSMRLAGRVAVDMLHSNVLVVKAILTKRSTELNSGFIRVPLELRDPNGLAVLAQIICFTPGTAWAELAFDRSVLLVHVLDLEDEAEAIATIKERYERPLREIFE